MMKECALPCALGIDSGYANTGIGVVNIDDRLLLTDVHSFPRCDDIQARITHLTDVLTSYVRQYQPVVIGLETYTAPSVRTRAMSSQAVAWHNWLIGACLLLPRLADSQASVRCLEAKYWQHALTGVPMNVAIGGKDAIERVVEMRTGHAFKKNSGGHKSDACGIALVALDEWQLVQMQAG